MRFVDLDAIHPSILAQIEALEEAKNLVINATTHQERGAIIEQYRARWTAVRDVFEAYSHGKCWYVECTSSGADNDIDHYRPKSRVAQDRTHPGYYWLAFDWKNLRLSCQRANRLRRNPETGETGGKGDNFPLVNPEQRASMPHHDLSLEVPAILDPTNPNDVAILTFAPNGEVDLIPECKGQLIPESKLDVSRRYLHLNWPKFSESRLQLYNQVERFVRRGELLAPQAGDGIFAVAQTFFDICNDLASWIQPNQQYSMAARAYVEMFRDRWWIRDIVLQVQ